MSSPPVTSPKNLIPPFLTIASGTYYARGKSAYLNLLHESTASALLIGCIQDRLIDLQASSRSNWHNSGYSITDPIKVPFSGRILSS